MHWLNQYELNVVEEKTDEMYRDYREHLMDVRQELDREPQLLKAS